MVRAQHLAAKRGESVLVTPLVGLILDTHGWASDKHILPDGGGWMDLHPLVKRGVDAIDAEHGRIQREEFEEANRKRH